MITLDRVSKTFASRAGEVHALADVSLEIGERELVTVVGASGCGKSTLLRLVAGLVLPSGGRVAIRGQAVTRPRSEIGIVFQSPTLLPWRDVVDNVLFPLRMTGRLRPDSRERALALIRLAGLAGFEGRFPRELSGGMQQRAAICRALVGDPEILLMDEPFGALDALTREEMSLELLRIWAERPKTIVFITHSIPEAVLLGDRVVVMSPRPGRIAEIIDVPLPRPRSFEQEATREFQHCAQRIRDLIFGARRAARPAAAA
jgi:NitT/TauT family transport system ATP-binding protein